MHHLVQALTRRFNCLLGAGGLACMQALAQNGGAVQALPQNVVSLSASASVEATKDWITVVFSTAKEGADASAVQGQLRAALDTALVEARKVAKPGQVEVQTGAFSIAPRYNYKPNAASTIVGWQGTVELVVEGRDVQAVSQLTAKINTLSIARVGFSLSREAREKLEADITNQAIGRFKARAEAVSKQFGFNGYTVREVAVNADSPVGMVQPMMRGRAMQASSAEESLPVEAGKATVTATVNGSVQMR